MSSVQKRLSGAIRMLNGEIERLEFTGLDDDQAELLAATLRAAGLTLEHVRIGREFGS